MADTKISALTALTAPASGDLIPIVDISDTTMAASGTTKRVTQADLAASFSPNWAAPGTIGSTTPNTGAFTSLSATGITTVASGTALLPSIVSTTGTADTGLWFPAADTLAASTAGSERIRISSTGNVGIGTTSPNATFVVKGTAGAPSLGSAAGLMSMYGTQDVQLDFGTLNDGSFASWMQSRWLSGAFAYPLVINPLGGNVGIGTTVPNSKLSLPIGTELAFQSGATTVGQLAFSGADFLLDNRTAGGNIYLRTVGNVSSLVVNGTSAVANTLVLNQGYVGIGTASPSYQLHVNTDSAGKPGAGGLWTVVSDERIKTDIVPADLSRCYDIVKQVGLKHFGFKPGVYSDEQINDKHSLGWIAQDVQKVFGKAVSIKPFTLQTDIPDGTEEYEEQEFTVETVNKVETSIQVINGKPVQASKTTQVEEKTLLFDEVVVVDVAGDIVMVDGAPLTHKVPRMVTKTRPKVRREVIEDCLDLNGGQMNAALYGAVQCLMAKVEAQAVTIASLQRNV